MSHSTLSLPACQKCKIRKVRCDRQAPKCGNCTKGNAACVVVDPVTGEQYARDYIRALEEQEARLKEQVGDRSNGEEGEEEAERTPKGPPTGGSTGSHGGYVGDGSGLGFLHSILSEAKWQQHRARILSQLAARPRIVKQHITPNPLPPLQEAESLLENYFTRFHIHHTFLLRQDVLDVFTRIYGPQNEASQHHAHPAPMPQDHFRLLMVFAISATTRYRAGLCSEHPYGYFMTAETYLSSIPLIKDIDAIQNLLLVARFGMYHHIGTSLWEISQVCMLQCIELRLHSKPSKSLSPLVEQHQRRIFWECYVLDRYSSGILGRPFAITEEEISVALPVDMYDDHILSAGAINLDLIPQSQMAVFTEVSIFISFIRLRRISSRIHSTFYTGRMSNHTRSSGTQSIGHAYAAFARFRKELDAWRVTVPAFADPRSLYERTDWHDFMYHKDMLLLTRGVMHSLNSTSSLSSSITKEILRACYTSASQVIHLYANLMDQRAITWTRSYFQVIFTAGLTVTYCISSKVMKDSLKHDLTVQHDAIETLDRCSHILSYFKEKMPDAGSFAAVFDLLRDECIGADRHTKSLPSSITNTATAQPPATPALTYPVDPIVQQEYSASLSSHNDNNGDTNGAPFEQQTPLNLAGYDLNFNLTEDLMTQLEAGIGEYAWGSLPTDTAFWEGF